MSFSAPSTRARTCLVDEVLAGAGAAAFGFAICWVVAQGQRPWPFGREGFEEAEEEG